MRPITSDDASYFVVDCSDDLEAFLDLPADQSSSGLSGRPCRNSIGMPG
jgi:hypothetical protein